MTVWRLVSTNWLVSKTVSIIILRHLQWLRHKFDPTLLFGHHRNFSAHWAARLMECSFVKCMLLSEFPNGNDGYLLHTEIRWWILSSIDKIFCKQVTTNSFESIAAPGTSKRFLKIFFTAWSMERKLLIDHSSHLSFLKIRALWGPSLARISSVFWADFQIQQLTHYLWIKCAVTNWELKSWSSVWLAITSRRTLMFPTDHPAAHPIQFEWLRCLKKWCVLAVAEISEDGNFRIIFITCP